jgi:hypothetical protein
MTFTEKNFVDQPGAATARLSNNAEIMITDGCWCPWCGDSLRVTDAEPLAHDAVRLICRCGHLILQFEPRPKP